MQPGYPVKPHIPYESQRHAEFFHFFIDDGLAGAIKSADIREIFVWPSWKGAANESQPQIITHHSAYVALREQCVWRSSVLRFIQLRVDWIAWYCGRTTLG
jgi:hypothetical protein